MISYLEHFEPWNFHHVLFSTLLHDLDTKDQLWYQRYEVKLYTDVSFLTMVEVRLECMIQSLTINTSTA